MSHPVVLPSLIASLQIKPRWKRYIRAGLFALSSLLLLTGIISLFQLYTKIPDSLLLYLLVVLALSSICGRFIALLSSLVAFFLFDFLFVAPLYSLIITKFSDFLTLIVFLVTAVITSQLTAALRRYASQAQRREYETRILYDLVRATNHEDDLEHQLRIFVQAMIEVFSHAGIRACTLLLPDPTSGMLTHTITAVSTGKPPQISLAEVLQAMQTMQNARPLDIVADSSLPTHQAIRLIPLKTEQQVLGVLRLVLEADPYSLGLDLLAGSENGPANSQTVFFRMFLEQAVILIERGRLRHESVRIQILQQTDTLRAALLSSVSHDLRTPLAAIMTAATSLQQTEAQLDEEAHHSLATLIEHESRRLNRLVENLLDMSRIEGGALRPQKIWYPLGELVRDVLGRMYLFLQGRMIQLTIPDDLPAVELDYIQIDQVVTNLLENAVRYTPAGSPLDIHVQLAGTSLKVDVADRGPGIAEAERTLIFDKFYRVQGKSYAAEPARGSGLGLSVCRGLVEAHNGLIWVEPREGGGAVFSFTLPYSTMEGKET